MQNPIYHTFQKKYGKYPAREEINSFRKFPTLNFRTNNLNIEAVGYLWRLGQFKQRSEFICQSINRNFMLEFGSPFQKEIFANEFIKNNFQLCKHLLRKIGRERKQFEKEILELRK